MLTALVGGTRTMHHPTRAFVACAAGQPPSVGVIGGGIAGVTAARCLSDAGIPVTIHERADLLGGRLGAMKFDDGDEYVGAACSYIHPKDREFVDQCQAWAKDGFMAVWSEARPHMIAKAGEWAPLAKAAEETWYVGTPHMASICTDTAGIDVCQGDVFDINYDVDLRRWVVASQLPAGDAGADSDADADNEGATWPSEAHFHSAIVLAVPVHEAAELLDRKALDKMLGRARYKDFIKERVSAVFRFERSLELPFGFAVITTDCAPVTVAISETSRRRAALRVNDGATGPDGPDVDSGDKEKEEVGEGETWVLQSATDWAKRALDDEMEDDQMQEALLSAFASAIGRSVATMPAVVAAKTEIWPCVHRDLSRTPRPLFSRMHYVWKAPASEGAPRFESCSWQIWRYGLRGRTGLCVEREAAPGDGGRLGLQRARGGRVAQRQGRRKAGARGARGRARGRKVTGAPPTIAFLFKHFLTACAVVFVGVPARCMAV
jgi:predicted NAD/FAD-dependent oxidoreductase